MANQNDEPVEFELSEPTIGMLTRMEGNRRSVPKGFYKGRKIVYYLINFQGENILLRKEQVDKTSMDKDNEQVVPV